jgi:7-keto-8-aminopelargonate synthetase-like enzyme
MSQSSDPLDGLSFEAKRALAKELIKRRRSAENMRATEDLGYDPAKLPAYTAMTFDMAMHSVSAEHAESRHFGRWLQEISSDDRYSFEAPRQGAQRTEVEIRRDTGELIHALNFGSYNYLGYGYHPEVIEAAKRALDQYGLGAASSPILSGTLQLHKDLEDALLDFFGLDDRGVSLFSSGYGVNTGVIPAFVKQGHHIVLDRSIHMSIQEGAQLSNARIWYFRHNDVGNLEQVLKQLSGEQTRVLVCAEGVYSADGDYGKIAAIVETAKRYGAKVLVDEAHSILVAGPNGRGVAAEQGVFSEVDLIVITFSKAFGGVGGCLIAPKEIARYVNWYARCRMFSCALDPAVTGGILKSLQLGSGADGESKRRRLGENAAYLRERLSGKVDIGRSESWIVPVMYGPGERTFHVNDYLQRRGLDASIMQFPAVPKNESRVRMFVSSEHTRDQIDQAATIICDAAAHFGFRKGQET